MEIEWIGTGSGLNPKLGNTSFLVRGSEGRNLLVDCGSTVPLKLIENGKMKEVTDVLLTHTHADHIGGIEGFAFMNYFAYRNREGNRPKLYVASDEFAHCLWEHSLKGGMGKIVSDDNIPVNANLETFFDIRVGKFVELQGLPRIEMFPTLHVKGMENYGLRFKNEIFYSGDSVELPPHDPRIIFQDCQFFETGSDVHVSYDRLKREVPSDVRGKIYLVHLGGGYEQKDAKAEGFAGFVMPGDKFNF